MVEVSMCTGFSVAHGEAARSPAELPLSWVEDQPPAAHGYAD